MAKYAFMLPRIGGGWIVEDTYSDKDLLEWAVATFIAEHDDEYGESPVSGKDYMAIEIFDYDKAMNNDPDFTWKVSDATDFLRH